MTVLTHQVSSTLADEWVSAVRVLRFPLTVSSRSYPLSLSLFRYLRLHATGFDLVHVHNYHTLVGHAAIGTQLPIVFTPHYHGTGHTPFAAFLHHLYRPVGARQFTMADAVICVSEAERDLVIKDFPGVSSKVVTIPNGTEPKHATSDDALTMLDEPMVLTVGRLERYKNVDLIINAFRALPFPAILVVVGDGPDRTRLEHHAEASGPGWPVLFTGRISDPMLDRLLARATVVTSASDHEAFGLTLTEGLASGTRVVASAIPAHAAVIRLVNVDAPVALVDPRDTRQFTDLLSASLLAGRIATGALQFPSWAEVIEKTRALYSQIYLRAPDPAPTESV